MEEGTEARPVINGEGHGYDKIISQVNDAIAKGAEVLVGKKYDKDEKKSYFFVHPTVLKNVDDSYGNHA